MTKKHKRSSVISIAITDEEFGHLAQAVLDRNVTLSSLVYAAIHDATDGFRNFSELNPDLLVRRRGGRFALVAGYTGQSGGSRIPEADHAEA